MRRRQDSSVVLSNATLSCGLSDTALYCKLAQTRRLGTISLLFVPAIGWVAFNMLSPLTNQLNRMAEMNSEGAPKAKGGKRRGVAGAVGLGAALSLAVAQQAEAATEIAQLAGSDGRWA